ncbi:MAG: electron transport complex subunit RsxC, partial [Candidatus Omnitrophota bacterium]|nr:electron transport complex subunit RsxC [Candidatus Omnitrophota bacterium]
DTVQTGQRIGGAQAHVYAPVHASISGKVSAIKDWPHPVLGRCPAVVIESDGLDRRSSFVVRRSSEEISNLTPEQIRDIVFSAGIVGMGGAGFPTHIKLTPPKPVDTLIINGAECEPYLAADFRLMLEKTQEILLGTALVEFCLGVQKVVIAIEDNKPQAIAAFRAVCDKRYAISVLKSAYPQGGEKQLIKNVTGREVPQGKLPFDVGVVVQNVATVYAIYEAVYLGKPLYERVVTVTGSCFQRSRNLLARVGTPIKDLIAFCGPLKEEPAKIIFGGPMMGIAQYSDDVPVIKTTNGVVLFNKKEARLGEDEACIRCGACVRECPAGLMPCLINLAAEKEIWAQALAYNAMDCIECGLCNFVCPARRRLTQSIKRAKMEAVK